MDSVSAWRLVELLSTASRRTPTTQKLSAGSRLTESRRKLSWTDFLVLPEVFYPPHWCEGRWQKGWWHTSKLFIVWFQTRQIVVSVIALKPAQRNETCRFIVPQFHSGFTVWLESRRGRSLYRRRDLHHHHHQCDLSCFLSALIFLSISAAVRNTHTLVCVFWKSLWNKPALTGRAVASVPRLRLCIEAVLKLMWNCIQSSWPSFYTYVCSLNDTPWHMAENRPIHEE